MAEAAACDAALPLLQAALSAAGGVELHHMGVFHQWGYPKMDGLFHGKSH